MCPCGEVKEGRTHIVGECARYKKKRGVLEMRKIDENPVYHFSVPDNSEKTIVIHEIDGGHNRRNRKRG